MQHKECAEMQVSSASGLPVPPSAISQQQAEGSSLASFLGQVAQGRLAIASNDWKGKLCPLLAVAVVASCLGPIPACNNVFAYTHAVCSLQCLYLSFRKAYQLDRMSSTGRLVTVQFFKLQLVILRS